MDEKQQQTESVEPLPRFLGVVRVIFFLSTFSWSINKFQSYASSGTPLELVISRIIPLLITFGFILATPQIRSHIREVLKPVFWPVIIYIFFGVLCGLRGVMPLLPLWKGFEMIVVLLWVAAVCHDEKSLHREMNYFLFYTELILYSTVILAVINPSRGMMSSRSFLPWFKGYFPIINPNGLGFLAVIVCTRLLFTDVKYKKFRLAAAGLIFLCAQSRTQYMAFAGVFFVFMLDGLRQKKLTRVLFASIAALGFTSLAFGFLDQIILVFRRGQSAEELESLSGRTDYWLIALEQAGLLGGGLATGSRSLIFLAESSFASGAVNLHNSYLEAILGAGFIGAFAFLGQIVVSSLRQLVRFVVANRPIDGIFAAYGIIILARSMMSIGPALFTIDFCFMLQFWLYIAMTSKTALPIYTPPRPRVRTNTELGLPN